MPELITGAGRTANFMMFSGPRARRPLLRLTSGPVTIMTLTDNQFIETQSLELLTADEAAKLLKLDPSTVYRLMRSGEIAVVRIGRSVRIQKKDLADFIAFNRD